MNILKFKNLETPYVIVLVGVPLCGKSTFCKEFIEKVDGGVTVISRDQIILDLAGTDDYNLAYQIIPEKEANSVLRKSLIDSIKTKSKIIIDMTNLTKKRRRILLSYFPKKWNKICIVFNIPNKNEIEFRNSQRKEQEKKLIPIKVIERMIDSYQVPEKEEGFDKVIFLN